MKWWIMADSVTSNDSDGSDDSRPKAKLALRKKTALEEQSSGPDSISPPSDSDQSLPAVKRESTIERIQFTQKSKREDQEKPISESTESSAEEVQKTVEGPEASHPAPHPAPAPSKRTRPDPQKMLRNKTQVRNAEIGEKKSGGAFKWLFLLILCATAGWFWQSTDWNRPFDIPFLADWLKSESPSDERPATLPLTPNEDSASNGFPNENEDAMDAAVIAGEEVLLSRRWTASAPPKARTAAFVESLQLSLIKVSGQKPGAFVNGIFYQPGDTLNPDLGLRFEGFDTDQKRILFSDADGVVYYYYY